MTQSNDKWNNVICWGLGCDLEGEPGRLEKVDLSKPLPYYIISDGKKAGIWCSRDEFRYVEPVISLQAVIERIEEIIGEGGKDDTAKVESIRKIILQRLNTQNRP